MDKLMDIENMTPRHMKQLWDKLCNKYLQAFCDKHGFNFEDAFWVGDAPGTIAAIGDYFVGMEEMRFDIDNNIAEYLFLKWYDYSLDVHSVEAEYHTMQDYKEFVNISFRSFCLGAPLPYSKKDLAMLRGEIDAINKAKNAFNKDFESLYQQYACLDDKK